MTSTAPRSAGGGALSAAKGQALVRRGLWLNWLTIGYNTLEAVVSIIAGFLAGSVVRRRLRLRLRRGCDPGEVREIARGG